MTEEKLSHGTHNAILENRKSLLLTGVTDVDHFDDRTVSLFTELGELTIQGRSLHVNHMDVETGDMSIDGDIWALCYGEKDKRGPLSFFGKLFR